MGAGAIVESGIMAEAFARGSATKRGILHAEGGVLSPGEFASRIGLTTDALEAESLLWLDVDGQRAYPAFQIVDGELLAGMTTVVEAFTIDEPWMWVNFMLTGDARLGGRRPVDALRQGRVSDVVEAAQAYGEHGAA